MSLSRGWRFSRVHTQHQSLYYDDIWVARIPLDDNFQAAVDGILQNPPPKVYPALYKDGVVKLETITEEKYLRELVKAKLVTPEQAYAKMPSIKPWLKKNNFWDKLVECTEIQFNGVHYKQQGKQWFQVKGSQLIPLITKPHFQSVWAARVAYATGNATLEQVAAYSWGAVLEVVGDEVFNLPDDRLEAYQSYIYKKLRALVFEVSPVCGFNKVCDLLTPVWYIDPIPTCSAKQPLFFKLLKQVLNREISGYGARLKFTNGHSDKVETEDCRWEIQATPYVPFLSRREDKIQAKATLEAARDYVQEAVVGMVAIGMLPKEASVVTFKWGRNTYGLRVASGKLFGIYTDKYQYIPLDFDKWSETRQKKYLEEDYDLLIADWEKRSRAFRRLYHYLKYQGLTSREAWSVATNRHRAYTEEYSRRKREAYRWACHNANKTATEVVLVEYKDWSVA